LSISGDDKFTILELVSKLYRGVDGHNGEEVAELFTDDGCLVHGGAGKQLTRNQIAEFVNGWAKVGNEDGALHLTSNPLFLDDNESAPVLRMQTTKYQVETTPPELWVSAELTLTARKLDGEWRIARFEIQNRGNPVFN
jgi:uncharacterized protein (TIGR02246 family)